MKPQPLSPETRRRLDAVFAPDDRPAAEAMLMNGCGNNLPFLEKSDMFELERFRFAALKESEGNLVLLRQAIGVAQRDWRDLLMSAGFGEDVTEHKRWLPGGMRDNQPMQRTGAAGMFSGSRKWFGRGSGR
jgi:hypothetical protein